MEPYTKVFDWMSRLPAEERLVYALIYQLTKNGLGFFGTAKTLSDRLNIPKSRCKNYLAHLEEIGAVEIVRQTILRKERRVFVATDAFAEQLQNE